MLPVKWTCYDASVLCHGNPKTFKLFSAFWSEPYCPVSKLFYRPSNLSVLSEFSSLKLNVIGTNFTSELSKWKHKPPAAVCWVKTMSSNWCMRVRIFVKLLATALMKVINNYKKPALTSMQRPTLAMFSVTRDLWPEINGFLGLIVEHFTVKFGDPSVFRYLAEKQTDKRR